MNLPIGTLLQRGKYEIKRFISAGGFGCTYEGVHTMLDTHVAIKEFFVKDFCNRDEQTSHVTVKLIDFGASKQYDEVDGENTSTLLGKTPGYAPIEQMGNTVRTFTPATDIYALGAEYPYETGEFFGFGDVTGKLRGMSIENYPAPNPSQIINGTQYDIAQYHWGDAWRMPTKQNIEELISKCTIKNTHINGKPCCEITGPNGNSIILPSTSFLHPSGNIDDTYLRVAGMYWSGNISSSTQAYYLHIVAGKLQLGERGRYYGLAVRPVYNK